MIEAENICVQCGLCCDGTLFARANIKNNETINPAYNFSINQNKKKSFRLPCAYLKNRSCAIYNNRPYSICERFICPLLKKYNNNEVSAKKALKIIATVEKYRNEILQALGDKSIIENDSIFTLVNNFKQNYHEQIKTASFREENKKLLLSIVGFEKIVTDNFKPPKTAKTNHNNTDEVILK